MDNYILLKAALLTEGICPDTDSLGGVGITYKEQNHGLFGWDFENHADAKLPDDFCLPDGTVVQLRFNSKSPYNVKADKSKLCLYQNDNEICEIKWIERPCDLLVTGANRTFYKTIVKIKSNLVCLGIIYVMFGNEGLEFQHFS